MQSEAEGGSAGAGPGFPDERPHRRREYSGAGSTLGVAALVILAVAVGIWWFEFRADTEGAGGEAGFGIVALPGGMNTTGKAAAAQEGRAAPNFRLRSPEGEASELVDYRGKYVLVNFWAAWCGPCRGEAPELEAIAEAERGRLVVLGVNQQEPVETVRGFMGEFGLTYPVVLDRTGEVSEGYRVGRGLPVTFLVDPQGVIVEVLVGAVTRAQLEAVLAGYLS